MHREPRDAPEHLPEQALRQVAFGHARVNWGLGRPSVPRVTAGRPASQGAVNRSDALKDEADASLPRLVTGLELYSPFSCGRSKTSGPQGSKEAPGLGSHVGRPRPERSVEAL